MNGCLDWRPQKAFADHFITDANELIENRTIFRLGIEYHIDYGGRGSGKTMNWADAVVIESSLRKVRVLVTRELQNSIDESIKSEIEEAITARGLDWFFDVKKTEITAMNGSKFIFKGIKNNIKSLKSISNVDIVLCEESENIQKDSWDKLLPSIRPKSGKPPIFIIIFNPDNELDDTYQRWIVKTPPNSMVKLINWRDNIYFPEHLERQRQHALKTLPPKDYENIWEGKPKGTGDDAIIQLEWVKAARFASRRPGFRKVGNRATAYDPAGQGRDYNAVASRDGNVIDYIEQWLKSSDLRVATGRAMKIAEERQANYFRYDECGGFGDGIDVFIRDFVTDVGGGLTSVKDPETGEFVEVIRPGEVRPFNAGDGVIDPDDEILGTKKTNFEMYSNAKAQAHGVTAQLFYNTFRFVELGHDVEPEDMISLDIEDDELFQQVARELSTPLWVKSRLSSKKQVESKKDMEKRAGLKSPNIADAIHMLFAPYNEEAKSFYDSYIDHQIKIREEETRAREAARVASSRDPGREGSEGPESVGEFF